MAGAATLRRIARSPLGWCQAAKLQYMTHSATNSEIREPARIFGFCLFFSQISHKMNVFYGVESDRGQTCCCGAKNGLTCTSQTFLCQQLDGAPFW